MDYFVYGSYKYKRRARFRRHFGEAWLARVNFVVADEPNESSPRIKPSKVTSYISTSEFKVGNMSVFQESLHVRHNYTSGQKDC